MSKTIRESGGVRSEEMEQDFDAALAVERAEFRALVEDPRSKALRYAFFAERETARVPGLAKDTPRRAIASAAVVGAARHVSGSWPCAGPAAGLRWRFPRAAHRDPSR